MTIPLRSMINTPSTPLCEEIRAIISSISAAVDDSTSSLEELILIIVHSFDENSRAGKNGGHSSVWFSARTIP